jgi:cell division protein FtsQ
MWALLLVYLVVAMGFVVESRSKLVCNAIDVRVPGDDKNSFIHKEDVMEMLSKSRLKYIGLNVDSVNTVFVEEVIRKHPAVKKVSAYLTVDGKLNIRVQQRKPVLRVINKHWHHYYIDEDGGIIPITRLYSSYTLVANGNISESFDPYRATNIFPANRDSSYRPSIVYDLFQVAWYIRNDYFWSTQIEQLFVDGRGDIQLIPRVGSQLIIFGSGSDINNKFENLRAMYKIFNEIGWNQYKSINLKYKDQVVCTKR